MTLESMRRGYLGGSLLSLFVIKEFGLDRQALPTLNALRGYLDREEELIDTIPFFLAFIAGPFIDHHAACKLSLEIIDGLAESQRPRSCTYYWEKGEG